ncbi:enoyl-CoA hydratase-related protein [Evansella sp. LMS18]|uniref:enoyl-CoA hydratase/isomerase family protein n=1 Tax=Evansella sp. LMS18 TaxID=2924033 RepID=UPI0020D017AB|nr:enoyl-CoA hydratase-related protein [Evansella sp. LMS18]UTR10260.1 enoyl-CoA hydratase-related protein [Evansella sp. LMS18]
MEYKTLKVEVYNNAAKIIFDRPREGNSVSLEFVKELAQISEVLKNDPEIRLVLLTGNGKHFSVGGDLKSFAAAGEEISAHLREVTLHLNEAVLNFVRMNKPVVAVVNGTVAGAGMGLVCSADIVIASDNSRFVMAYTKAGLTPDGGTSYLLPRLIGLRKSMELALLNRMLTAEEALEWGLITRTCSETELESTVDSLVDTMASGAVEAFGKTKDLLYSSLEATLEDHLEKESLTISEKVSSLEGKEGITAFLEKRKPNFN